MSNVHIPDQLDQLSKSKLLEVAKIMHEENIKLAKRVAELVKAEEKERLRKEYAYRMEEQLIQENKHLKRQRFRTYNDEEYIIFFDDGEDYPDSMVAPVVMSADKFRELYYAREELRKEQE